jgi:hypothetical protein
VAQILEMGKHLPGPGRMARTLTGYAVDDFCQFLLRRIVCQNSYQDVAASMHFDNQADCLSKNYTVPDEVLSFNFKFIPDLCQIT